MKHTIISLSVPEDLAREINALQKTLGYSGRSELLRQGFNKLLAEHRDHEKLKGQLEVVLIVVHSKHAEIDVTHAKHEFEDIISTQIHNNLSKGKCLELFFLRGNASRIKNMYNQLHTSKKIDYVKLVVT